MSTEIEIDVSEVDLSQLLTKVEAGEDVVLSRGAVPVARVTKIAPRTDIKQAIEAIFKARQGISPTTIEEILAWRDEDRR